MSTAILQNLCLAKQDSSPHHPYQMPNNPGSLGTRAAMVVPIREIESEREQCASIEHIHWFSHKCDRFPFDGCRADLQVIASLLSTIVAPQCWLQCRLDEGRIVKFG